MVTMGYSGCKWVSCVRLSRRSDTSELGTPMYGLPLDFDAGFLVGRTLEQVRIGTFQVSLVFDDALWFHFETDVTVTRGADEVGLSDASDAGKAMVDFLGRSVERASGTVDGTITLEFDNCDRIKIHDSSERYESYQIKHGENFFVV